MIMILMTTLGRMLSRAVNPIFRSALASSRSPQGSSSAGNTPAGNTPAGNRHRGSHRAVGLVAAAACVPALLSACSNSPNTPADGLQIVTSVYPLQFAAEAIAGSYAHVTNLTPAGAEPHDLELSVQQVQAISDAALMVYVSGLAQAVDDAANQEAHARVDARDALGSSAIVNDPHFWLDPILLAKVGDAIAGQLSKVDPAHAKAYAMNARAFTSSMAAVDRRWLRATNVCATREFVASHASFGYLARRYHLTQHAVLGLSPDVEPTPSQLQSAIDVVRANKLTTVFSERLLDSKIASTIAKETGTKVAVLDPIEGDASSVGYIVLMQENLAALVAGNRCRP